MKKLFCLMLLIAFSFASYSQANNYRKVLVLDSTNAEFRTTLSNNAIVYDSEGDLFYILPTGNDDKANTLDSISDKKISKGNIKLAKVVLDSTDLIALNGTPQVVLAAPGTGYVNVIENCFVDYAYSTAEYAGDSTLAIYYHTLGNYSEAVGATDSTLSKITNFTPLSSAPIGSNKAIYVKYKTSDPGGGSGTATIYLFYKKEEL